MTLLGFVVLVFCLLNGESFLVGIERSKGRGG